MTDVQRIIRYAMPGLACVVLLLPVLFVTGSLDELRNHANIDALESLGIAVGTLIASGGLGFLLANFYFAAYWTPPISTLFAVDHRSIFRKLTDVIEFIDTDGNVLKHHEISGKREAWTAVINFWQPLSDSEQVFSGLKPLVDRLVDCLAGVGATLPGAVAIFIPYLIWLAKQQMTNTITDALVPQFAIAFGLLVVILALARGHMLAKAALQKTVNAAMTQVICARHAKTGCRVRIYIDTGQ